MNWAYLDGHAGDLASVPEDGGRDTVGGVTLVSVVLEDNTSAQRWAMVLLVVFTGGGNTEKGQGGQAVKVKLKLMLSPVVWMNSVSLVG